MEYNILPLYQQIKNLKKYNKESTILAKRSWEICSESIVKEVLFDDKPKPGDNNGFEYFLEVSVANEFIEGFETYLKENGIKITDELICERLIRYAITDA